MEVEFPRSTFASGRREQQHRSIATGLKGLLRKSFAAHPNRQKVVVSNASCADAAGKDDHRKELPKKVRSRVRRSSLLRARGQSRRRSGSQERRMDGDLYEEFISPSCRNVLKQRKRDSVTSIDGEVMTELAEEYDSRKPWRKAPAATVFCAMRRRSSEFSLRRRSSLFSDTSNEDASGEETIVQPANSKTSVSGRAAHRGGVMAGKLRRNSSILSDTSYDGMILPKVHKVAAPAPRIISKSHSKWDESTADLWGEVLEAENALFTSKMSRWNASVMDTD